MNYVSLSQPPTGPSRSDITRKSKSGSRKSQKSLRGSKVEEDEDDSEEDFVWSDDEEYVPEDKKIPIRRVASFDEEDRRPRTLGYARRSVTSAPGRRLAVDDIRRLSYQQVYFKNNSSSKNWFILRDLTSLLTQILLKTTTRMILTSRWRESVHARGGRMNLLHRLSRTRSRHWSNLWKTIVPSCEHGTILYITFYSKFRSLFLKPPNPKAWISFSCRFFFCFSVIHWFDTILTI